MKARNSYFQAIKRAKTENWNSFLENATSEDIWTAYKYCSNKRKIEQLPVVRLDSDSTIIASSFSKKCDIFLDSVFKRESYSYLNYKLLEDLD